MASNNFAIFFLFYFFLIYGLADTGDDPTNYDAMANKYGWLTSPTCISRWKQCYAVRDYEFCLDIMIKTCKDTATTKITMSSTIATTKTVTAPGTVIEATAIFDIGDLTSNSQADSSSSPTSSTNPFYSSSTSATPTIFSTNSLSTSKLVEKITQSSMTDSIENVESKSNYILSTMGQADLSLKSSIRPVQASNSFPFSRQYVQSSTTDADSHSTTSSSNDALSSMVSTLSLADSKPTDSSLKLVSFETSVAFQKFTTAEQPQMSSISKEFIPSTTMEPEVSSKKSFIESTTEKLSTSPAKWTTTNFDQTKATTTVNNKISSIGKSTESSSITTMKTKITNQIMDLTSQTEIATTPIMAINNVQSSTDSKSSSSSKLSTNLLNTAMPIDKFPLSSSTQIIATTSKETQDKVSGSISSSLSPSQFAISSSISSSNEHSTPHQSSTSSNEMTSLSAANSINPKISLDFKSSDSTGSSPSLSLTSTNQGSSISSNENSELIPSSAEIKSTGITNPQFTKTKMPSVSSSSIPSSATLFPLSTDDKLISSMYSSTTLKDTRSLNKYSSTERSKLFTTYLPNNQATTESELNSIPSTPQSTENLKSETTDSLKASTHPREFKTTETTFEIPRKPSDSWKTPFLTGSTSESIIKTSIDPSVIKSSRDFTPSSTTQRSSSNSVIIDNSQTTLTLTQSSQGSTSLITNTNNNKPVSETTISNLDGDKLITLTQPSSPSLINNKFGTSTITDYPSQINTISTLELKSSDASKNYESTLQSSSIISTAKTNPTIGATFTSTEGEMDDVISSKIYTESTKTAVENHEISSALQTTTKIINPTSVVVGDASTKSQINYDFTIQSSNYFKYPTTTATTNNLVDTSTRSQNLLQTSEEEQEMSSPASFSSQSRRSTDETATKSTENDMTTSSELAGTTLKIEANIDTTFKPTTNRSPTVFDITTTYSMDDKERTSNKLDDIEVTIKGIDTTRQIKAIISSHPTRGSTAEKNIKVNTEESRIPSSTTDSDGTSVSNNFDLPFEKVSTKTDKALMSTNEIENVTPLTKTSALKSSPESTATTATKGTKTSKFIDLTLLPQKQTGISDTEKAIQLTNEASSPKITSGNLVESETSRIPFSTKESSSIKPSTISPTSDSSKIQTTMGFPIEQQSSFKTITESETSEFGSTKPISKIKFSSTDSFIDFYTSPISDSKIIYSSSPKANTEDIIDDDESSSKASTVKAIIEIEEAATTQSYFKSSVTTLSGNNDLDSSSMKIDNVKETQIANFPTSKSGSLLDQSSKPPQEFTTTMMEEEESTKATEYERPVTIAASMTTTDISNSETIITEQQQVSEQLNTKTSKNEMQTHSQNSIKLITNEPNILSSVVENEAKTQITRSQSLSIKTSKAPFEPKSFSSMMDESSISQSHITKQRTNKLSTQAASKYASPSDETVDVTNEEATDLSKFVTIETSKDAQASEPLATTNQAKIDQSSSAVKSKFEMSSTEKSISKVSSEASTMATPKVSLPNIATQNTASLTDKSSNIYSSEAEYSNANAKTSQVSNIGTTTMPETSPFKISYEITSSKTPLMITTLPDKPESKSTAAMTKNKLIETTFYDTGKTTKVTAETKANTYSSDSSLNSVAKSTNSQLSSVSIASTPSFDSSVASSSSTSLPAITNPSCETTLCPKGFVEGAQSCFRWIESVSSKGLSYKGLEKLCMAIRDDAGNLITAMVAFANFFKIFGAVPSSPSLADMEICNMFFWGSATFFIYSLTLMCAESLISLNIIMGRWNNIFHRQRQNRQNKTISALKFHFLTFIFAFIPILILWNSATTMISFKSCTGTMNYFVNDSNELNTGVVLHSFIIVLYTSFACTLGLIARMKINVPQYENRRRQQIMASGPFAYGREIYPVEFSVRYCLPVLRPLFLSAAWMSAIYSRETLTFYASAIDTGISGIHGFVNFIQSQTTTAECMDSTIETGITMPSWMPRFIKKLRPRYNPVTLQTRDEILRICDPKQWKEEKEERAAQQHPDTPRIRYPIPFEEHIERDGPLPYRVITMGFRFRIFRYEMDPYAYDLSLLKRTIPMELQKHFKTNWTLIYLENRANGLLRYESMAQVLMEIKKNHLANIYIPHRRIVALFKNFMANMVHIDQLQIKNPGSRHEINVEAQAADGSLSMNQKDACLLDGNTLENAQQLFKNIGSNVVEAVWKCVLKSCEHRRNAIKCLTGKHLMNMEFDGELYRKLCAFENGSRFCKSPKEKHELVVIGGENARLLAINNKGAYVSVKNILDIPIALNIILGSSFKTAIFWFNTETFYADEVNLIEVTLAWTNGMETFKKMNDVTVMVLPVLRKIGQAERNQEVYEWFARKSMDSDEFLGYAMVDQCFLIHALKATTKEDLSMVDANGIIKPEGLLELNDYLLECNVGWKKPEPKTLKRHTKEMETHEPKKQHPPNDQSKEETTQLAPKPSHQNFDRYQYNRGNAGYRNYGRENKFGRTYRGATSYGPQHYQHRRGRRFGRGPGESSG